MEKMREYELSHGLLQAIKFILMVMYPNYFSEENFTSSSGPGNHESDKKSCYFGTSISYHEKDEIGLRDLLEIRAKLKDNGGLVIIKSEYAPLLHALAPDSPEIINGFLSSLTLSQFKDRR